MRLLEECRQLAGTKGKVAPWALAPVVQRTLGWRPDRAMLALLVGILGEVDPGIQLVGKLRVAPEEVGARAGATGAEAGQLTWDDAVDEDTALELIRQLAGTGNERA